MLQIEEVEHGSRLNPEMIPVSRLMHIADAVNYNEPSTIPASGRCTTIS